MMSFFALVTPKRLTPISLKKKILRIAKSHNSVLGPEHSRSAWQLSLLVIFRKRRNFGSEKKLRTTNISSSFTLLSLRLGPSHGSSMLTSKSFRCIQRSLIFIFRCSMSFVWFFHHEDQAKLKHLSRSFLNSTIFKTKLIY